MLGKLTAFADHIRNALINASQLAQTVNELQAKVSQLQSDVEQTQQANRTLNETVQSLTEQRNAVVAERDSWREAHKKLQDEHDQLHNEHETLKSHASSLEASLYDVQNEHSKALEEVRRLTNESALLNERLRRTQRYIDNMKATLAGDQTRDVENGQFEELPKVQQAGGSSW